MLQDESEFQSITAAHIRPFRKTQPTALALASQLPGRSVIEELVTVFFSDINWHYFILEKYYFDDLFSHWLGTAPRSIKYISPEKLSQELEYFPALLFQIIALTVQFLPPDAPVLGRLFHNEPVFSQKFSDIGEHLMTLLGREGVTITAVEADFLRSSWLKNFGRGIAAWHSLGNAIRLASSTPSLT